MRSVTRSITTWLPMLSVGAIDALGISTGLMTNDWSATIVANATAAMAIVSAAAFGVHQDARRRMAPAAPAPAWARRSDRLPITSQAPPSASSAAPSSGSGASHQPPSLRSPDSGAAGAASAGCSSTSCS